MSKLSLASKTAREYCERFKETGSRPLAKKLYKENKKLYKDENDACYKIRYVRGGAGKYQLKKLKDKSLVKEVKAPSDNQYNLPESKTEHRDVWKLPKSIKKVLLLSDLHFPYQDNRAISAALDYGKKENVDAIFINGDMLDFYQLSFHEKDPRLTSIPNELKAANEFFKSLKKNFPRALIYYIPGNHEYRLQRYLRIKAPELLDVEEFRLDILLKCGELGIHYLEHGTKCYFGKLLVEHGDKMRGSGGVNPARTLFLRLKRHAICGHFHRTQENVGKIYDGEPIVTYSTGCLCELEPRFLEVNEHNHGFALVEMIGENFTVHNKKIVNGKVF